MNRHSVLSCNLYSVSKQEKITEVSEKNNAFIMLFYNTFKMLLCQQML